MDPLTTLNYSHALHAASLYVEELKYAEGPRRLALQDPDAVAAQFDLLLRDAGIKGLDPAEIVGDSYVYGRSFEASIHVPRQLAHSIFVDGLMHGVALAAGLRGSVPA